MTETPEAIARAAMETLSPEDRADLTLTLGAWPVLTPEAQQLAEVLGITFAPIDAATLFLAAQASATHREPIIDLMIADRKRLEQLVQDCGSGSFH